IELMERLSAIGSELLSETLLNLETIPPRKQDDSAATFAPILKKEDGLINWSRPAGEIANRVRAFQPFPTSFSFVNGSRLTIWKASVTQHDELPPSTVSNVSGSDLVVACGEGTALV